MWKLEFDGNRRVYAFANVTLGNFDTYANYTKNPLSSAAWCSRWKPITRNQHMHICMQNKGQKSNSNENTFKQQFSTAYKHSEAYVE